MIQDPLAGTDLPERVAVIQNRRQEQQQGENQATRDHRGNSRGAPSWPIQASKVSRRRAAGFVMISQGVLMPETFVRYQFVPGWLVGWDGPDKRHLMTTAHRSLSAYNVRLPSSAAS